MDADKALANASSGSDGSSDSNGSNESNGNDRGSNVEGVQKSKKVKLKIGNTDARGKKKKGKVSK